ncbi:hypothetical protein BURK_018990 [Burkholderia sp. SJ98]|nr:hypothetical protein BURK_018990 [Burkholderia sp. SJ98]
MIAERGLLRYGKHLQENAMNREPSDPVQRADERREALGEGDVKEKSDGTIEQREHGNIDPTLVPKGKDHPEQGPYTPEHDLKDPDTSPDASADHPKGKRDSEA